MSHSSPFLPWLLALATAAVFSSTDFYVPCLPEMMHAFNASESELQLTISLNGWGYCLASPLIGPLSDAYGRRPLILVFMVLLMLLTLACVFVENLHTFYVIRFLQGVCSSATPVIGMAIVTDLYRRNHLAKILGVMGAMITFSFGAAPVLGGIIGHHFGWRSLFLISSIVFFVISCLQYRYIPETLKTPHEFTLHRIRKVYKKLATDPIAFRLGLLTSFALGGYFSFITTSSYYYIDKLSLSQQIFGFVVGASMSANVLAHFLVGPLVDRFGRFHIFVMGNILIALSCILLSSFVILNVQNPWILNSALMIYSAGLGFVFPTSSSIAMDGYRDTSGTASAFFSSIRMMFVALAAAGAGLVYQGTLLSTSIVTIVLSAIGIGIFLSIRVNLRHHEDALHLQEQTL